MIKHKHIVIVVVFFVCVIGQPARLASADPGAVPAFYYGWGDGYLGDHHAAWYHGHWDVPPVVNLTYHGVATAEWDIPFKSVLLIEVVGVPGWAEQEYGGLIGRKAVGIVVDRMAPWVFDEFGPALDCWPALAAELMGEDWERIGTVDVRYQVFDQGDFNGQWMERGLGSAETHPDRHNDHSVDGVGDSACDALSRVVWKEDVYKVLR